MAALHAIVDWEDDTSSFISLQAIVKPRLDFERYTEGQKVHAKFGRGAQAATYNCAILKIEDDKKMREKQLDNLIARTNTVQPRFYPVRIQRETGAIQQTEGKCKMIELVPGSGAMVSETAERESKAKASSTVRARCLLNIELGSVKAVGSKIINTIALYCADPSKSGDFSSCKLALRSKITSTISYFKKHQQPNEDDTPEEQYKTPEFVPGSDSDSDIDEE